MKPEVQELMELVDKELRYARGEFPRNDMVAGALLEEAGEVWQGCMDGYNAQGQLHRVGDDGFKPLKHELIQLVAMCVRLWEEGDSAMHVPPLRDVGKEIEDV